jgi:hypothetical protein
MTFKEWPSYRLGVRRFNLNGPYLQTNQGAKIVSPWGGRPAAVQPHENHTHLSSTAIFKTMASGLLDNYPPVCRLALRLAMHASCGRVDSR